MNPELWARDDFGGPVVLHRGKVEVGGEHPEDTEVVIHPGEVRFELAPSPRVVVEYGNQTAPVERLITLLRGQFEPASVRAVDPELHLPTEWDPLDRTEWFYTASGALHSREPFGNGPLTVVTAPVVNFQPGLDVWFDGDEVDAEAQLWRLVLRPVENRESVHGYLKSSAGFEVTHTVSISRPDGSEFSAAQGKEALDLVHWFLAFVNGAPAGIGPAFGRGPHGAVTWGRFSVTTVERWHHALSWCSVARSAPIVELWPLFCAAWAKEGWESVLRRGIGAYLSANDPKPLDLAVISAAMVLALMAPGGAALVG